MKFRNPSLHSNKIRYHRDIGDCGAHQTPIDLP
jgi:hypothetical protein